MNKRSRDTLTEENIPPPQNTNIYEHLQISRDCPPEVMLGAIKNWVAENASSYTASADGAINVLDAANMPKFDSSKKLDLFKEMVAEYDGLSQQKTVEIASVKYDKPPVKRPRILGDIANTVNAAFNTARLLGSVFIPTNPVYVKAAQEDTEPKTPEVFSNLRKAFGVEGRAIEKKLSNPDVVNEPVDEKSAHVRENPRALDKTTKRYIEEGREERRDTKRQKVDNVTAAVVAGTHDPNHNFGPLTAQIAEIREAVIAEGKVFGGDEVSEGRNKTPEAHINADHTSLSANIEPVIAR